MNKNGKKTNKKQNNQTKQQVKVWLPKKVVSGRINCNESARRSRAIFWHEESPSTVGHGCRVTPCQGDLKESATEIYRTAMCKGGNVR